MICKILYSLVKNLKLPLSLKPKHNHHYSGKNICIVVNWFHLVQIRMRLHLTIESKAAFKLHKEYVAWSMSVQKQDML